MSCYDLRSSLGDLLDGGLEPHVEQALREHLGSCPACRAELEREERLRRQVAALPRTVQPPRDLWPDVVRRLGGERQPRAGAGWSLWLGLAAAVAMVGAVLTGMLAHPQGGGGRSASTGPVVRAAVEPGMSDFERARATLLEALEQRRGALSEDTVRVVLDAVGVIDRSVAAIGGALDQHPGDPGLTRRLAVAYRQEIALLQRAARLPNET